VAATVTRPRVEHPRVEPWEYVGLQTDAGWCLPIEFIDGEAVVMPPIAGPASSVQGELFLALRGWQERTDDAGLVLQDVLIAFRDEQHMAPDICWWSAARRPPIAQSAFGVVPDLVVEVLSPSTRANDLGVKREQYMRSGVKELWLADPDTRTVTRVRLGVSDEVLDRRAVLHSELLDGFALDLTRVFQPLETERSCGRWSG
jgi:Uma2 family endonuclease